MPHIWLRAETKKNEQRTALTPSVCRKLMQNGFEITVERCSQRIIPDSEYASIGCNIVPHGSWRSAPQDCYIMGLKELPENDNSPLIHKHIMFAHCYKQQAGWREMLDRFVKGNGLLLDLEFLMENGRRVAAFGYYAGFAGAAVAIDIWCHNQLFPNTCVVIRLKINPFPNQDKLIEYIKQQLAKIGRQPSVMVMGALGRCGKGAVDFAVAVGIPESKVIKWDMAETAAGGPFKEIIQHDIFINCIYLSKPIPPFLTKQMLSDQDRSLSVLCDVSCDATNPHNPVPVYYGASTFDDPIIRVEVPHAQPLDVIAIDHLPTLLPLEASEAFCNDLLPSLLALKNRAASPVWSDAEALFISKSAKNKL
eukprot:jgi/Hompol1/4117/HPOL_003489-RA